MNSMNSDKSESVDKTNMENNTNDRELNDNNITNNKLNNNEHFDDINKNACVNDKINIEKKNSDSSNNDISIKNISADVNANYQYDEYGYINCDNDYLQNEDIQHIVDNENNSLECDHIVIKNVEYSNNFNNEDIGKSDIFENNQVQKYIIHNTNNSNDNNKFCMGEDADKIKNINTSYKNIYSESIDDSHKDEFNYKELNCIKMDNSDFNKREQYGEKNGSISPIKMNNNSDKSDDLNNDRHEYIIDNCQDQTGCNMGIWNKSKCEYVEEMINYESENEKNSETHEKSNNYNLEDNELDKNADNFDEKKEKDISENCLNSISSSNDKNNCNNNNSEYNNGNNLNKVCINTSDIFDLNNKTGDYDIIMKNNENAEIDMNKIKETEEEKNNCGNNESSTMSNKNNSNNKENINEIKNAKDDNIVFNSNNVLHIFKEKENKIKQNYEIASEDNVETDAKLNECKGVNEKEINENDINNGNNNGKEYDSKFDDNNNNNGDKDRVIGGEGNANIKNEEKELNNYSFEKKKKCDDECEKSNMENDNCDDINKKRKHISSYDESRKDRKLSSQKEYEEIENEHINKYGNDIDTNVINTTFCKNNNTNITKYVNNIEEIISSNNMNGDSKNNSNSSALNLKIESNETNGANDTNESYFSDMKISNVEGNYNYNDLVLKQDNKDSLNKEEKNDINNLENNCKDECSNKSQNRNIEKNDGKNDSEHSLENLKEYDEKTRDNDDEYEDEQNENMSDNNYSDDEKTNLDNCNTNDRKKNKNDNETLLPIANISRIMKRILPAKAKVAKESKDIIREYVTEFIQFLTSEVRQNEKTCI